MTRPLSSCARARLVCASSLVFAAFTALAAPVCAQSDTSDTPAEPEAAAQPSPDAPPAAPALQPAAAAASDVIPERGGEVDASAVAAETASAGTGATIRYRLEAVRVAGNHTRKSVVTSFVPLKIGAQFDVDDPAIEEIRWRLLGTGWFDDVKLSLTRGSQRGWVVLLIEVKERNTLLVDQFVMGLSRAVTNSDATHDTLRPYVGLGLSEANFLGQGVSLSGAAVFSSTQYGLELGYRDPRIGNTGFSLTGRVFHNYAREFFGRNPLVVGPGCPVKKPSEHDEDDDDTCDPDIKSERAVVIYHRTGIGIGTGHEITSRLHYSLDWLGEYIAVLSKPPAASTVRGNEVTPIDFRIQDGNSLVSSLRFGIVYDDRDHPTLTQAGDYIAFDARFGSHLFGSSYDFARFELSLRHWFTLPWKHVLSLGLFVGSVFGDAPFFYDFYAADLSDLLPSRVLELNLDRRRTLNLLGTSIVEMDMEDLAARIDFQYQVPLHRGGGFVRGIDAYLGAGVFLLTAREDLRVAISGYHGLARVPIDLTFDLGIQADTDIGLFKLGFSSLIGFSPLGRESP